MRLGSPEFRASLCQILPPSMAVLWLSPSHGFRASFLGVRRDGLPWLPVLCSVERNVRALAHSSAHQNSTDPCTSPNGLESWQTSWAPTASSWTRTAASAPSPSDRWPPPRQRSRAEDPGAGGPAALL